METLTIYVGVIFAASIAALADYMQNKAFLGIRDEINNARVTVYRGPYGSQLEILVRDLVVGDII